MYTKYRTSALRNKDFAESLNCIFCVVIQSEGTIAAIVKTYLKSIHHFHRESYSLNDRLKYAKISFGVNPMTLDPAKKMTLCAILCPEICNRIRVKRNCTIQTSPPSKNETNLCCPRIMITYNFELQDTFFASKYYRDAIMSIALKGNLQIPML